MSNSTAQASEKMAGVRGGLEMFGIGGFASPSMRIRSSILAKDVTICRRGTADDTAAAAAAAAAAPAADVA
jgi:hypothetical protein